MLREVVRFEWHYHSRQAAFPAASLLFLILGFTLSVAQLGPDNVAVNSSYLVMQAFGMMSLIALIVAGVFAASAVLRDDDHQMSEVVRTLPVRWPRYVLGRVCARGKVFGEFLRGWDPEESPADARVLLGGPLWGEQAVSARMQVVSAAGSCCWLILVSRGCPIPLAWSGGSCYSAGCHE